MIEGKYESPNSVNKDNFNGTCKGYVTRAFKIAKTLESKGDKLTEEQEKTIMCALRWAFDEMTLSEARKEYNK